MNTKVCFLVSNNGFCRNVATVEISRNCFLGTIEHLVCRKMCNKN